jgi:integrase
VYDVGQTGFAAIKLPSGQIHFTLDYGPRQHRRRVLIGVRKPPGTLTLDDARSRARVLLGDVEKGADPVAERAVRRNEPTFADWAATYIEMVKTRKKSWADDVRYLGRAAEWWGHLRLSQVTTERVEQAFQETHKTRGRISANRFLASIRACLQQAWRLSKVVENVAAKVAFMSENPPRARVLSAEELQAVLQAVAELEDPWERSALTLIIETGARKSEALRARWEDFDLEAGEWRIPSPKAGHPQVAPLGRNTVTMLRNLPRLGEWVFPGRGKESRRSDLRDVWARIRKAADVADVTIHDLRRTFGLEVARSAGLHVASRLLRHSTVSITAQVYAPLGIDELRKASEKVARQREKRGKVLRMQGRAG